MSEDEVRRWARASVGYEILKRIIADPGETCAFRRAAEQILEHARDETDGLEGAALLMHAERVLGW